VKERDNQDPFGVALRRYGRVGQARSMVVEKAHFVADENMVDPSGESRSIFSIQERSKCRRAIRSPQLQQS